MAFTVNFTDSVRSSSSLSGSGNVSVSVVESVNIAVATTVTATLDSIAFTNTALVGMFLVSDTDVTVTFVGSGSNNVFSLLAGVPLTWNTGCYLPIPLTHTSVSSVTVHNATAGTAIFQAQFCYV